MIPQVCKRIQVTHLWYHSSILPLSLVVCLGASLLEKAGQFIENVCFFFHNVHGKTDSTNVHIIVKKKKNGFCGVCNVLSCTVYMCCLLGQSIKTGWFARTYYPSVDILNKTNTCFAFLKQLQRDPTDCWSGPKGTLIVNMRLGLSDQL